MFYIRKSKSDQNSEFLMKKSETPIKIDAKRSSEKNEIDIIVESTPTKKRTDLLFLSPNEKSIQSPRLESSIFGESLNKSKHSQQKEPSQGILGSDDVTIEDEDWSHKDQSDVISRLVREIPSKKWTPNLKLDHNCSQRSPLIEVVKSSISSIKGSNKEKDDLSLAQPPSEQQPIK